MKNENPSDLRIGAIYALLAYLAWGFFPIYWKFLKHVSPVEILCHRVLWAFVFYSCLLVLQKKKSFLFWPQSVRLRRNLLLAAVLLMANWFVYIYAVNSNQIVESSLGYFINPLVNIAIGVGFLKEKLNLPQKIATALAFMGVLIISIDQGRLPWIAFFLAISFSLYGLIKKTNPVPALESNQFESFVMVPVAILFLFCQWKWGNHVPFPFQNGDIKTGVLLVGAGAITGLPLIFFAEAAQRMPFYLLGFFQFLAPSLQFMTGVYLYSEPLSSVKIFGFVFIWMAGLLIIFNNVVWSRRRPLKKIKAP